MSPEKQFVYVQDQNGKPLMPTQRRGVVRRWLKSGRAQIVRREPFTIRLLDVDGGYIQPLQAGVDLGTAHVGVAVVSEKEEVFAAEFKLRADLSDLLTDCRMYRRTRRGRKCCYRALRFLNRKHQDELAPSVRAKVDEALKVMALVNALLPVASWTLEIANFGEKQSRAGVTYLGAFFRRQNRKLFKGARSHIRNTIPSAKGFKRGDRVRLADGQEGFVFGLRSSGYFDVRQLDGTVLHHSASHKTLRRLEGARTLRIERRSGGASSHPLERGVSAPQNLWPSCRFVRSQPLICQTPCATG